MGLPQTDGELELCDVGSLPRRGNEADELLIPLLENQ